MAIKKSLFLKKVLLVVAVGLSLSPFSSAFAHGFSAGHAPHYGMMPPFLGAYYPPTIHPGYRIPYYPQVVRAPVLLHPGYYVFPPFEECTESDRRFC